MPCLLNAAACLLKLGEKAQAAAQGAAQAAAQGAAQGAAQAAGEAAGEAAGKAAGKAAGEAAGEAAGGERRHALTALSRCAEVLRAGPCAASRAKALFRQAQAHAALHNWREAWQAVSPPPPYAPHIHNIS